MQTASQNHLTHCRATLLGAQARLATFRRLGALNSNDHALHDEEVRSLFHALDLVWAAQLAVAR